MVDHVQLTEKAAQVARSMLSQQHRTGEYVYQSVADIAGRLEPPISRGTVTQIVKRLSGYGWLEDYQELGGGERLYRFHADGADAAHHALGMARKPARQAPQPPEAGITVTDAPPGAQTTSMAHVAAAEPPETLAAIRRALGWDSRNRPLRPRS